MLKAKILTRHESDKWITSMRRCRAGCGKFVKTGQSYVALDLKDPRTPYELRRLFFHSKCLGAIAAEAPLTDVSQDFAKLREELLASVS